MTDHVGYSEWQLPNFSSFLPHLMIAPAIWATLAPFNADLGLIIGMALMFSTIALRFIVAKKIIVSDTSLQIGSAKLPSEILGDAEVIAKEEQFFARGALAHPNTFFALKSGLPGLVRVQNVDPKDPSPYALIATRNPERLAAAIKAIAKKK